MIGSEEGEGGGEGEGGECMLHVFKPRYSGEEAVDLQVMINPFPGGFRVQIVNRL